MTTRPNVPLSKRLVYSDIFWAAVLLCPNLIGFLVFMLFPMVASLWAELCQMGPSNPRPVVRPRQLPRPHRRPHLPQGIVEHHLLHNRFGTHRHCHFLLSGTGPQPENPLRQGLPGGLLPAGNHLHGGGGYCLAVDIHPEFGLVNYHWGWLGFRAHMALQCQVGDAGGHLGQYLERLGVQHGFVPCRTSGYSRCVL